MDDPQWLNAPIAAQENEPDEPAHTGILIGPENGRSSRGRADLLRCIPRIRAHVCDHRCKRAFTALEAISTPAAGCEICRLDVTQGMFSMTTNRAHGSPPLD